jgi:hypothetical protein
MFDGLEDHEGYTARQLPDGTITSGPQRSLVAYIAACGCGWRGGSHAPTHDGYDAAVEEWERDHGRPVLARTVPPEVREKIREVTKAVAQLMKERPVAGRQALRTISEWSDATVARTHPGEWLSERRTSPGRSLGR